MPVGAYTLEVVPYQDNFARGGSPWTSELQIELTERVGGTADSSDDLVPATVNQLTAEEAATLFSKVPVLPDRPSSAEFSLPVARQNPPPAGGVEVVPFPPRDQLGGFEELADHTLQVVRYSPTQDVDRANHISLTFSMPMVPLTSQAELAELELPVTMKPEVPGSWRWVGTRTLMFQAEGRLPGATTYEIEVPAEFPSEGVQTLEFPFRWEFSTAPLKLIRSYPGDDPQPLRPLIALEFNQEIDVAKLKPFLSVRSGGQEIEFAVIKPALFDLPADLEWFLANAPDKRTIVVQPLQNANHNTTITVEVAAGAPSNEGPLPSLARQLISLRTFGGLNIAGQNCAVAGRNAYDCEPGEPFYIFFNHQLDAGSISANQVALDPPLLDGKLIVSPWGVITITGQSTANTLYTLTLQPGLRDEFGQTFSTAQEIQFKVGEVRPWMREPGVMKVLQSAAFGIYPIHARNLNRVRVQVYQVEPADWGEYLQLRENLFQRPWSQRSLFGSRPVFSEWVDLEASAVGWTQHDLDLNPYLVAGKGHLVIFLTPARRLFDWESFISTRAVWIQSTGINVEAFADDGLIVARASSLDTGAPSPAVSLILRPQGEQQETNKDGQAFFVLDEDQSDNLAPSYLEAKLGPDTAILPRSNYYSDRTFWRRNRRPSSLRWHVFTDRQLYKPNEEVHVKGWLRYVDMDPAGDVEFAGKVGSHLEYTVQDSRGIEIGAGSATLNRREALAFDFAIPADANSGYGHICLHIPENWMNQTRDSDQVCTGIEIQEFRRPEFELILKQDGSHRFLGDKVPLELQAKYFGGGPLASSEVSWEVTANRGRYTPPGWDEFTFGGSDLDPWNIYHYESFGPWDERGNSAALRGISSIQGLHGIDVTLSATGSPVTQMLYVNATVQDVSQQTQSVSDQLLIHPSNQYVGAQTESYLLRTDRAEAVSLIVVDVAGKVMPGIDIEVQALLRQEPGLGILPLGGELDREAACEVTSTLQPVKCEITLPETGLWDFRISTTDGNERENVTLLQRYAVGAIRPPMQEGYSSQLELIPDKDLYAPGETARILLQNPFLPAHGTLLVNRGGILTYGSLEITEGQHLLEIPIEETHVPNLTVSVYLTGATSPEGEANRTQIRAAQGNVELAISTKTRELNLELNLASADLTPGSTAEIEVLVTDQYGQPVADAEIVLLAVDEAILSLAGYVHGHPVETFYAHRYRTLSTYQLLDNLLPVGDQSTIEMKGGFGGGAYAADDGMALGLESLAPMAMASMAMADAGMVEEASTLRAMRPEEQPGIESPSVRKDFNPLAVFEPAGSTDSEGRFTASWTLPDLVGQYRVVSLATFGPRLYGVGEASLVSRLPLQIRAQLPRFLNFGDTAQLQLIVENQTLSDQAVTLFLQSNGLELGYQQDGLGFDAVTFTVPAQSRRLAVRPATAAHVGPQRVLASAFNDEVQDHLQAEIPVYTPAAKEGFAAYGTVEDEVSLQTFQWPANVYPDFGALEVSVSSTLLQSLVDGYLDIQQVRWLSTETLASRILANSVLREILPEFKLPNLPATEKIDNSVQADILRLQGFQNSDGGFPLWQPGRRRSESWPFTSVHALHALVLSRVAGYDVSDQALESGLVYLVDVRSKFHSYYSQPTRDLIEAYALYVRALQHDVDSQAALGLLDGLDWQEQSPDALAWIIQVLNSSPGNEEEIQRVWNFLLNRVDETAGKAVFASSYREEDEHLVLSSNKRSSALLLQALIKTRPETDLMTKLVAGLLSDRRRGHWGSTQSNVFVILAMHDYYRQFEETEPNFHARAWLDDTLVYNEEFSGRSLVTKQTTLPNSWLAAERPEKILLQRDGEGRMYYRLGFSYVPADLQLDPIERGFTVLRSFYGLDNPADVRQDRDGVWHIELGARVGIKVTMVTVGPRYHVSLVSPVPAGLELINPALEGVEPIPDPFANLQTWYYGPWYDHQQLLDERAQAVATYLPGGVHEYDIVARATTAGTFLVPPAAASEIYASETFGHGATDHVVVASSE